MNARVMLAFAAAAVAAGAVILYLAIHAGDAPAEASPPAAPPPAAEPSPPPPAPRPTPAPSKARPSPLPTVTPNADVPPPDQETREYIIDGKIIRDHRTGNHRVDLPRGDHAPNTRLIAAKLTQQISKQLLAVVGDCAREVPDAARGTKPRLEGRIQIAIQQHQVHITEATMQLRQVTDPVAAAAAKACVERNAIGLTTAAPDEEDLERYAIRLSYALP